MSPRCPRACWSYSNWPNSACLSCLNLPPYENDNKGSCPQFSPSLCLLSDLGSGSIKNYLLNGNHLLAWSVGLNGNHPLICWPDLLAIIPWSVLYLNNNTTYIKMGRGGPRLVHLDRLPQLGLSESNLTSRLSLTFLPKPSLPSDNATFLHIIYTVQDTVSPLSYLRMGKTVIPRNRLQILAPRESHELTRDFFFLIRFCLQCY